MTAKKYSLPTLHKRPWFPYVAPFFLFLCLTEISRFFPSLYHQLYLLKTVLTGALLWYWRARYAADFQTRKVTVSGTVVAGAVGLLVLVLWIAGEPYFFQIENERIFNPKALGTSPLIVTAVIAIRLVGSSTVVPIMEELFWRSFLMRYLIKADFRKVPLGTFSFFSLVGTTLLFGLEHHRLVAGILAGLLYGLLLIRQKNLLGVVIAHAVTNLGLGLYILLTKSWHFW